MLFLGGISRVGCAGQSTGGREGTFRTSLDLYPFSKKRKKEKFKSDIQIDGSACIMYLPT